MLEGFKWFLAHLKNEHTTLTSHLQPGELLARVALEVAPRPPWQDEAYSSLSGRTNSLPEKQFTSFFRDFKTRGSVAIRSRGLWGQVYDSHFWFEVATGYGAQRWWIPRVKATVSQLGDKGSEIKYRLIMIQLRQRIVWLVGFGIGVLAIIFGTSLLISASSMSGGTITLTVGVVILVALFNRAGVMAFLAQQMAENLRLWLEQISRLP